MTYRTPNLTVIVQLVGEKLFRSITIPTYEPLLLLILYKQCNLNGILTAIEVASSSVLKDIVDLTSVDRL